MSNFRKGQDHHRWKERRITSDGYVLFHAPAHPRANHTGKVLEHVLIAERVLGRLLPEKAEVHHLNANRADNRNCNLVICQDHAYHFLLHQRQRAVAEGFPANWLKCWICQQYEAPEGLLRTKSNQRATKTTHVHRACNVERCRLHHLAKKERIAVSSETINAVSPR